jgi:hypothetical protein
MKFIVISNVGQIMGEEEEQMETEELGIASIIFDAKKRRRKRRP